MARRGKLVGAWRANFCLSAGANRRLWSLAPFTKGATAGANPQASVFGSIYEGGPLYIFLRHSQLDAGAGNEPRGFS